MAVITFILAQFAFKLKRSPLLALTPACKESSSISASPDAAEHRSGGSRLLWRPGIRRQHQGSCDSPRPDGDDQLRPGLLHRMPRLPHHLPGELRRGRPHHNLLRRAQPQDRGGLRQDRQSTRDERVQVTVINPFSYLWYCNIEHWPCFSVQTIEQLENELLNGQKLQGPATAAEVHQVLKQKNMVEK